MIVAVNKISLDIYEDVLLFAQEKVQYFTSRAMTVKDE